MKDACKNISYRNSRKTIAIFSSLLSDKEYAKNGKPVITLNSLITSKKKMIDKIYYPTFSESNEKKMNSEKIKHLSILSGSSPLKTLQTKPSNRLKKIRQGILNLNEQNLTLNTLRGDKEKKANALNVSKVFKSLPKKLDKSATKSNKIEHTTIDSSDNNCISNYYTLTAANEKQQKRANFFVTENENLKFFSKSKNKTPKILSYRGKIRYKEKTPEHKNTTASNEETSKSYYGYAKKSRKFKSGITNEIDKLLNKLSRSNRNSTIQLHELIRNNKETADFNAFTINELNDDENENSVDRERVKKQNFKKFAKDEEAFFHEALKATDIKFEPYKRKIKFLQAIFGKKLEFPVTKYNIKDKLPKIDNQKDIANLINNVKIDKMYKEKLLNKLKTNESELSHINYNMLQRIGKLKDKYDIKIINNH